MQLTLRALLICLLASAAVASAQDTPPPASPENPLSAWNKTMYGALKNFLLSSAEKTPEEHYSFKPTDSVRTFGQILGHAADSQYRFCSVALGEKSPELKIEQTKTSKADLIAALKDASAYCDKAYDSMTDASAAQMVKFFGREMPRMGVLSVNNAHVSEHYGNLVTYMRMKNIFPPSTESRSQAQPKK